MKHIFTVVAIAAGAAVLCLAATPANAQFQITIGPGLPNPVVVTDNGPLDTDPALNAIGYKNQVLLGNGVVLDVDIHAIQSVANGHARVSFDKLLISNIGQVAVTSSITLQSAVFPAVGPPFNGRAHLDGRYLALRSVNIKNASISLTVSVLQPAPAVVVGTVTIPAVVNRTPPVAFGPFAAGPVGPNPDQAMKLQIGATQVGSRLDFTLGMGDAIAVLGSAFVGGYTSDRTFVVNSTADLEDGLPGDGVCDTGNATTGFTGICTLRAALTEADQQPVVTAIQFNIPGSGVPVIQMQSDTTLNRGSMGALQQVIVDGTTQPGGLVEVNGKQASPVDFGGVPIVGIDLVGQKSDVLGMIIHSFPSHGIQIRQSGSPFGGSNNIEENALGIDSAGVAQPNGGDGIHISQMPSNVIADNVIANNAGQGVSVDGAAATGNLIHSNSINANGGLGISLTNGGNGLESSPVLTTATEDGSDLTIGGTLHSAPNLTFTLDFYINSQCDPTGSGEGETYLGSTSTATDPSGNATFKATMPANLSDGSVATATATDPAGNTSEFSACVAVQQVQPSTLPPIANAGPNQTVSAGTLVTLDGSGSHDPNVPPLPITFVWTQTSGSTVTLTGANTATPSFTPAQAGSYVFSLVVNNGVLNSAAASVTITVVSLTPIAELQALIATLDSLGLPDPLEKHLERILNAALAALTGGDTKKAVDNLQEFIEEVNEAAHERRDRVLTDEQAVELIAAARQIIQSINPDGDDR